jgi:Ca-activated chloride channel family protein
MNMRILLAVALYLASTALQAAVDTSIAVLWPEHQRAFIQDAPSLLLSDEQKLEFLQATTEDRDRFIEAFLGEDPIPETPENELQVGIERRLALVRHEEFLSFVDHRARVLFLNGPPAHREIVDCGQVFVPIEVWFYGPEGARFPLIFHKPTPESGYRAWFPTDSKRVLFNEEMEYFVEQLEELGMMGRGGRWLRKVCPDVEKVDEATGVEGLRGFQKNRPTDKQVQAFLAPPVDLGTWSTAAAATQLPNDLDQIELSDVEVLFPAKLRQRMITRFLVSIPSVAGLEVSTAEDEPGLALALDGEIVQGNEVFERFRVRFKLEPPAEDQPVALVVEQPLRPDRDFVIHLAVVDEVGGAMAFASRGFTVPEEAQHIEQPPVPEGTIVAMGNMLSEQTIPGRDSLVLVPPPGDVVLGLWRAEALVTGERITKVKFLVDDVPQMTRNSRPFTAELRLGQFPVEQFVRAEGYDATGELVDSDEVVINQPRGAFRVRIMEPMRGASVSGHILSKVEITIPEERRVESVEFKVNEGTVATLEKPPWEAEIDVPPGGSMAYLSVVATLDDGSRSEEVRFLNSPQYLEEVDVKLVELFTTVTDKSGRLVKGLTQEEFVVQEDGRPQTISKFELVENLPLTLGIVVDTSTSMADSLAEAKQAALGFLHNMITLRDKVFALAFSSEPTLLIPTTDDVEAVEDSLEELVSHGATSLHDAVVTSLYYFRGVRGRRAMVLLSDGDDTTSAMPYRDALEYARRSGVTIYTIGLDVGRLETGVRSKLSELAKETGGRTFFISKASELVNVYREIEEELRSQYLVAYSSDRPGQDGVFRQVEVKVRGGKLKARTISGYYP